MSETPQGGFVPEIKGKSGRLYHPAERLAVKELADVLGRSESYVYAMINDGFSLPAGRQTPAAAIAYLEAHPQFRSTGYFRKANIPS